MRVDREGTITTIARLNGDASDAIDRLIMRTTITLDDDVAALIASERAKTGESFRTAVNRLLRRGAHPLPPSGPVSLPKLPGRPLLDVSDVSALLATLDDERPAGRGVT